MVWAPDYASVVQLAAMVRITDALDNAQMSLAISSASRAIDLEAGRQFGQTDAAEARYYTASWDCEYGRWAVEIDDLMVTAGMSLAFDTASDLTFATALAVPAPRPANAAAKGRPWTRLLLGLSDNVTAYPDAVRVTAQWGWSAVPTAIVEATLLQASRLLSRRDAPFGVAGSPDAGSEMRLLAKLDPDVAVAIGPYRRWWGAV